MPTVPTLPQRRSSRLRSLAGPSSILIVLALGSLLGPWLLVDIDTHGTPPFLAPTPKHWLGTDVHGRDVFARVLLGSRLSLFVGTMGAALSLGIGTAWGVVAGYLGGRTDFLLMRIVDILGSLPNIVFAMVALVVLEPPVKAWAAHAMPGALPWIREILLISLLGSISWLNTARIVRGSVLGLRSRAFVEASRALGASPLRIIGTHILPNITGIAIACVTLAVPSVILYESFLSFLGLGVRPPSASLGTLIADGAAQLNPLRIRWWLLAGPACVLALSLGALHSLGIRASEATDVRKRQL